MYTTDMVMTVLKLYIHGVKSSDGIKVIHHSLSREAVAWFLMYASRNFVYAYKNNVQQWLSNGGNFGLTGAYIQIRKQKLSNFLLK